MYNAQKPDLSELPSTGRLLKSTGVAAGVAAVLLVTAVLPAEYAIDPTGLGRVLGLTDMGEVKVALAKEAEAEASKSATVVQASVAPVPAAAPAAEAEATAQVAQPRSDEVKITLAPSQAAEIKLVMQKGVAVDYVWETTGPRVNFDTHADAPGISYHGYGKGSSIREEGVLTAAFDGSHGWFWRNRSGQELTVTLHVKGGHTAVKRVV